MDWQGEAYRKECYAGRHSLTSCAIYSSRGRLWCPQTPASAKPEFGFYRASCAAMRCRITGCTENCRGRQGRAVSCTRARINIRRPAAAQARVGQLPSALRIPAVPPKSAPVPNPNPNRNSLNINPEHHRHTCLSTWNSSPSMVVDISAHLPRGHSLFHAHVPLSTTEVLLSQDRTCVTVCRCLPASLQQTIDRLWTV